MSDDIKNRVRERLLREEYGDMVGTWKVFGEDPNCDMGGSHVQPDLGTVSGRYRDVVEYALSLGSFIGWGYGGSIKRVLDEVKTIPKGFTAESLKDLYAKKTKLELELAAVEEKIRNLDVDYE